MKILLVHPGADTSTSDVHDGLMAALRRSGVEVIEYALSRRINQVASWLEFNYAQAKERDPDIVKPTFADTLYLAAERSLPIALMAGVDWVLVMSSMFYLKHWLVLLRRAGLPVGIVFSESPYDDAEQCQVAPYANVVWTNERLSVAPIGLVQPNTFYLPHAFDPDRHRVGQLEGDDAVAAHDVVFVGTAFAERIELLEGVNWEGIDLGLYGNWETLPDGHPLHRYVRGAQIPNDTAAALYRRAKIGLNLYRKSKGFEPNAERIDAAESLNPRALELAACGAFHLSDYRAEVGEVFGDLVPTFSDSAELERLIRSWLARPAERASLAAQLPSAVAARTFNGMAAQVIADLERVTRTVTVTA